MHFSVVQRYTFYKLTFEIEIRPFVTILNQITIHFSNVRLSSSPWKQNISLRYGKKVVDIRKITLHFHKTLTLGYVTLTLTFNVHVI